MTPEQIHEAVKDIHDGASYEAFLEKVNPSLDALRSNFEGAGLPANPVPALVFHEVRHASRKPSIARL